MTNFFYSRHYAIMCLFRRAHGLDILQVRQFADGRIEIDARGYCVPLRTFRGRVYDLGGGKCKIKLCGKQLTATIV